MANSNWSRPPLSPLAGSKVQCEIRIAEPLPSLEGEWPFVVTARDDYGMMRDTGFNSLLLACDFAHYMDARPLGIGARDVLLYCREQGRWFIPAGGGFSKYEPRSLRKAAGGSL